MDGKDLRLERQEFSEMIDITLMSLMYVKYKAKDQQPVRMAYPY